MEAEAPHVVTLHPGSEIELTMYITTDISGKLHIRANLSDNSMVDTKLSQSKIERGKYRAFSNAVHSAVYAAPQSGVRIKSSYAISTDDKTGAVTCTIPATNSAEAAVVMDYLSIAPSRIAASRLSAFSSASA